MDPFGGVYFQRGSDTQIRWEASFEGMIDIYFSSNGGNSWNIIQSNINANLGAIDWTVPNISSTKCKIKISSGSDAGRKTTSYNFTIGNEQAQSGILVDEKYEDWDILPDIAQVTPGVESDRAIKAFNDENFLYIYFETGEFLSLQNDSDNASDHLPLIGDFSLSFEQEETDIYALRQNDKDGIPVKIDQVVGISGVVTASNEFGNDGNSFIQDNQAAIAVHGSDFISQLTTGDSITLTGTVTQISGLTRLTIDPGKSNLTVHKNVKTPNPRIVTIAEIRE